MNFFEHQQRAKRRTSLLVLYFVAAVFAIVAAVAGVIFLFLWAGSKQRYQLEDWWLSDIFIWSCLGTLTVIVLGSAHKLWQLRGGGSALAAMLNAREVTPSTSTDADRRYRNVVEEMAIASGIPVPRTFVMDEEQSINAFVAGYRPTEAVVVITAGTLNLLSRDELQGVIAHEFSHIFNADMKLNMRLLSVLSGILTIGRVGEFLMHSNRRHRHRHRSRRDKGEGAIILLGLALMVIGYVGLFFGRLIKAAISRQREFLADASSVQFTRNPSGIAGALIKIHTGAGTYLDTTHAEDMSHMCFGQTVSYQLKGLLATHPDTTQRLKAIGTEWLARARVRAKAANKSQSADSDRRTSQSDGTSKQLGAESMAFAPTSATADAATANNAPQFSSVAETGPVHTAKLVGTVSANQVGYAAGLLESIPESLRESINHPDQARLVIYAMASRESGFSHEKVKKALPISAQDKTAFMTVCELLGSLGDRLRLPIIDLAIPSLKQLPKDEQQKLLSVLDKLTLADAKITLFEFCLTRLLRDHLGHDSEKNKPSRFRRYSQVESDIQIVMSALISATGIEGDAAQALFKLHAQGLLPAGRRLVEIDSNNMAKLDQALLNLRDLSPLLKAPLIDAFGDLILADKKVQVAEAELLRTVCTLLDSPLPLLFSSEN